MKAEDYNPDFYKTLDELQESTKKRILWKIEENLE